MKEVFFCTDNFSKWCSIRVSFRAHVYWLWRSWTCHVIQNTPREKEAYIFSGRIFCGKKKFLKLPQFVICFSHFGCCSQIHFGGLSAQIMDFLCNLTDFQTLNSHQCLMKSLAPPEKYSITFNLKSSIETLCVWVSAISIDIENWY